LQRRDPQEKLCGESLFPGVHLIGRSEMNSLLIKTVSGDGYSAREKGGYDAQDAGNELSKEVGRIEEAQEGKTTYTRQNAASRVRRGGKTPDGSRTRICSGCRRHKRHRGEKQRYGHKTTLEAVTEHNTKAREEKSLIIRTHTTGREIFHAGGRKRQRNLQPTLRKQKEKSVEA